MKISFIVVSVDRDQDLRRCIASIQAAHAFNPEIAIEILAVIQNAKQKTGLEVSEPEKIAVYYLDQSGLSHARNYAIKKASGDYLVFLDDDATVKVDFILKIGELILRNPQLKAFSGCLINPGNNLPFATCYALKENKLLGWGDFQLFRGSAIILRRDLTETIGFFDERFGVGAQFAGAEDSDIFFRIKQAKEKVEFFPELVFYHQILAYPPAAKVFSYAYAVGAMLVKQSLRNPLRFYFYLGLIVKFSLKNLLRLIQCWFLPFLMADKCRRYQYGAALRGMLAGAIGFLIKGLGPNVY